MRIRLPEIVVEGKRLGRSVHHDPRSLRYLLPPARAEKSVQWARHIPILDQGNLGSCTGNATVGALGSGPLWDALVADGIDTSKLDEAEAVTLYSAAEKIDGGQGYPPEDNGSSGLSVAKAAHNAGLISGYQHATSVSAAHTALQAGPFITGTSWFSGMDSPTSEGIVKATGTVRGGHEYVCREYDAVRDLWWFDNSWGTSFGVQGRFAYDSATMEKLLGEQGDITALVPISAPAPTPTPAPSGRSVMFTDDQYAAIDTWAAKPHVWHTASVGSEAWKDATR